MSDRCLTITFAAARYARSRSGKTHQTTTKTQKPVEPSGTAEFLHKNKLEL
jgi:hypothetical protein